LHPLRAVASKQFELLDRRLDAEHWHRQLVARAAAPFRFRRDHLRFVARQMLRPRPRWYERCGPASWRLMLATPVKQMTADLKQLELHREWLADRFDSARVRWCRRCAVKGRAVPLVILLGSGPAAANGLLVDRDPGAGLVTFGFMGVIALVFWVRNRLRARRLWRA
jgi:hypothetical protein